MTALMTADELLHVNIPHKQVELVRGVLGFQHGAITAAFGALLKQHVDANRLGLVLVGDPGFKLAAEPDTVRGPDIAFIRTERVPHPTPTAFATLSPDFVIEIRSSSDRPGDTLGKVGDWLSAGTPLVWVIDPAQRLAHVYWQDGTQSTVSATGVLDGEGVVPGFSCALEAILA